MNKEAKILSAPVIVAALGYFVDIYDLVLFSIVRKPSLKAIGLSEIQIENYGLWLLNIQMIGMLIGGVIWGIIGDKKGRLSVLFGSILGVYGSLIISCLNLCFAFCFSFFLFFSISFDKFFFVSL
jgi:MFS family permease